MTEATIIALVGAFVGAIPPTIMAYAALVQGRSNGAKAAEVTVKTDALIEKTAEIHTLTNGSLSRVTAELELANSKISGLERLMAALALQKSETAVAQAALLQAAQEAPARLIVHGDQPVQVEVVNTPLAVATGSTKKGG